MRTIIRTDFWPGLCRIYGHSATKTAKSLRYSMKPLRMTILAQTLHQVDAAARKTHLSATTVAKFITQTFGFFRSYHPAAQRRRKESEPLLRQIYRFKSCDFS